MMSNLVSSIALLLLLLPAAAAFRPAALPQAQPRQEPSKTTQPVPETEQASEAPAEGEQKEEEGSEQEDAEADEEEGPKRQPGLLPLEQIAVVELGARAVGPGLVFEDSLIVATEAGAAICLDGTTGELLWKLGLPGSELLPPSLFSETLLLIDRSGTLVLVDPTTGTIARELSTGVAPILPPASNQEVVFLGTADSAVVAYHIEGAREVWRSALEDVPLALSIGGDLLAVSDRTGALYALEVETGARRWRFQGRGTFQAPAAFDAANKRLFLGDTGGTFYSLSARDGKVHYRWASGAAIPLKALVEEDRVYVATFANTLFCYRPWNGHELWRANLPGRPAAAPERARRRVVVVTFDGQVAEYGSGGTKDSPFYLSPTEILPAPTLMPGGLALPMRTGRLLLLQTKAPAPKIVPGEGGELGPEGEVPPPSETDTPTGETETTPGSVN